MSEELPQDEVIGDAAKARHAPGWLSYAIDYGPLLIFFAVFRWQKGPGPVATTAAAVEATLAFMAAMLVAMAVARWKLGRISPMLWLSGLLVVGFGALTVWFNDPKFIQIKPTIIYAGFAAVLLGGLAFGKALIKPLLAAAFEGLTERGWWLLSRNWGLFFAGMALLNELLRYTLSFDDWLTAKVWGVTALSLVFALAQLPLMLRHGLKTGEERAG